MGETGRNFAAGMSGGVAYVFDENKTFTRNLNAEMVDLDALDAEDFDVLRRMVREHFRHTGSQKALTILNDWNAFKSAFVKIMPRDYKAVLAKRKKAAAELVVA